MKKRINRCSETELDLNSSILTQTNQFFQEIQRFSGNEVIALCSSCSKSQINFVKMPSYSTYHAAIICGQCNHFLEWQPKLENQEKWQRWQIAINQLLKFPNLNQQEKNFLEELRSKRLPSPKQQEVLVVIEAKVERQD